jgi:N-acetylmuramoyl-L-alanine amidase
MKFLRFGLLLLCLGLGLIGGQAAAWAQAVLGVRVGEHSDKTRVVFDVAPGTRYSISTLATPPQLLVDFPAARWQGQTPSLSAKSGLVAGIQVGGGSDNGQQFKLALKQGGRVQDAFVLPPQGGGAARLVVDVVPAAVSTPTPKPVLAAPTPPAAPILPPPVAAAPRLAPVAVPDLPKGYKPIIVIDPGHGGKDPGAIGRRTKVYEKNVVLQLSRELREALHATGRYRVMLTRDSDIFIPLGERPAVAQKARADLFLSVHADSALASTAVGASIYTLSENASDREAARLAARENRSDIVAGVKLEDNVDPLTKSILLDLMQRDTMNLSDRFADMASANLARAIRTRTKTHGYAGFMVLLSPDVPSALLEAGFLSNPTEEQLLTTRAHRVKIVSAMVKSIDEFFRWKQMVSQ